MNRVLTMFGLAALVIGSLYSVIEGRMLLAVLLALGAVAVAIPLIQDPRK